MVICKEPIITKRYEFLFSHLDCDCIADTTNEKKTKTIKVIAYSENKNDNMNLEDYYVENGFKGKYKILQNISKEEVNSID